MSDKIYSGRPTDKRIPKEERCYDFLDSLGIKYERVDHDSADTMEACEAVEKVIGCGICKNLLLTNRQMSEVYLLLMPGAKPFKTKILSKQIETARLSFASAEQMERYLDITPGSVSVLGLINDKENAVHLLIDKDLMKEEYFGCHPCINTSTLKLRTEDVLQRIIPAMGNEPRFVDLPWEAE